MKKNTITFSVSRILILLLPAIVTVKSSIDIKRSDFPDGFLFGTATSAYQVTIFTRSTGFISERTNLQKAVNSDFLALFRLKEHISKMVAVQVTGIIFAVIYHMGTTAIQLRIITIATWEDFVYFAEICFKNFADRVKYWATINEPNLFVEMAYVRAVYPPARCSPPYGNCTQGNSDVEPLAAVHNMLLAHAKASKLYGEQFKWENGMIGIVVHAFMYIPLTDNKEDKEAAKRALAFNAAWILDPVVFGDYPPEMRRYHGNELPNFSSDDKALLRDSIDFIGINHYSTFYAKDCIYSSCICNDSSCTKGNDRPLRGFVSTFGERNGVPIGEPTGMTRFFVVPKGMEDIVLYVKERYHNKPIFVTENGYSSPDNEDESYQHDVKRINFHKSYLSYLAKAIRNGADVRGYFIWTLMDDFEWANGYIPKFGLYRIHHPTLTRIPKLSAGWYRDFLSNTSSSIVESSNYILSDEKYMAY